MAKQIQRAAKVEAPSTSEWGRFNVANEAAERYNIVAASQGVGGAGKTHFWLTAPEPIAVFLFDPAGLKGLLQNPIFKHKDIRVINYYEMVNFGSFRDKSDRAKAALDALHQFREDWQLFLKKFRTGVWDKEDHVWEMLRYATHEDFSAEPKTYYELNMEYRGMFSDAESAGVNFGVIRGMRQKWGKTGSRLDRNTGQMKDSFGALDEYAPRGQKEVEELVQVNLEHHWDGDAREFKIRILDKCRLGNAVELLGTEYGSLDFLTLATMLYPDVDDSVWRD